MKLRVMVMAWNADAQEHFWMDYCHNRKSENALMRELSRGIKEGAWIAWRIITIESEGGAAITCGTSD